MYYTCADQEGAGEGGQDPPPPKNHKNRGVLSNTGLDFLNNHKATKPAFNVGHIIAFKVVSHAINNTYFINLHKPVYYQGNSYMGKCILGVGVTSCHQDDVSL